MPSIRLLLATLALPSLAAAQAAPDSAPARVPLLTRHDLIGAAAALAAAAVLSPLDVRITHAARGAGPQGSALLRRSAHALDVLGGPGAVVLVAGAYGIGRVTHGRTLTDVGLHVGEALVVGGATTTLAKAIIGRQRPSVDLRDPDDFTPGRGIGDRASLPSGHTTVAFAVASALAAETHHWWPSAPRAVAPALYGAAALVGAARVYGAEHWASDVVTGAVVGTLAGRATVRHVHGHPHGRLERWLGVATAPSIAPLPHGGLALTWTASAP